MKAAALVLAVLLVLAHPAAAAVLGAACAVLVWLIVRARPAGNDIVNGVSQ